MSEKLLFIGDCRTILDEDSSPFADATQMAQAIEDSQELDEKSIEKLRDILGGRMLEFNLDNFGQHNNIAWAYDIDKDIHFFFEIISCKTNPA